MNKGGLVLVVVVDYLVGDGFIGVGLSRIRRPYEGFGDGLKDAESLNEFANIVNSVDSTLILAERHKQLSRQPSQEHSPMIPLAGSMISSRSIAALSERRWTMSAMGF